VLLYSHFPFPRLRRWVVIRLPPPLEKHNVVWTLVQARHGVHHPGCGFGHLGSSHIPNSVHDHLLKQFQQSKPNEVARAVEEALKLGYRHIDAAATYDNEEEVGAGIKASGVPRSDIFLTSKLWNTHHKAEDVEEAVDESLKDLQTDYLDLYLIHWPVAFQKPKEPKKRAAVDPRDGGVHVIDVPVEETWRAMEEMVEQGKIRMIGLSNFTRERVEEVLSLYVFIMVQMKCVQK
jgi:diketogulonate reductase-like aldo/keto reductase